MQVSLSQVLPRQLYLWYALVFYKASIQFVGNFAYTFFWLNRCLKNISLAQSGTSLCKQMFIFKNKFFFFFSIFALNSAGTVICAGPIAKSNGKEGIIKTALTTIHSIYIDNNLQKSQALHIKQANLCFVFAAKLL